MAFGIGYAQAEERLFQMELLRRAAEGRLSRPARQPVPTDGRAHSPRLRDRRRAPGARSPRSTRPTAPRLQHYADGVNAVIARDELDPSTMPAGLTLPQDLPLAAVDPVRHARDHHPRDPRHRRVRRQRGRLRRPRTAAGDALRHARARCGSSTTSSSPAPRHADYDPSRQRGRADDRRPALLVPELHAGRHRAPDRGAGRERRAGASPRCCPAIRRWPRARHNWASRCSAPTPGRSPRAGRSPAGAAVGRAAGRLLRARGLRRAGGARAGAPMCAVSACPAAAPGS